MTSKADPRHAYDDPSLDALGFLRAVKDDPTVPRFLRKKAKKCLRPYEGSPAQYPDVPDPLSASPNMRHYYEGHLKIIREYYKKFPTPRKPPEFFFDIQWAGSTFHSQNPNVPHQSIEFYVDLLHVKRCLELTLKTGKVVNPDLEATEPEGHA